ncbi:hypothetical protein COLO4_01806, partial [Corchorus olitorius]
MPCRRLSRRTEERLAQLLQVLRRHPGPVITHAEHDPVTVAPGRHFDRLAFRIEAQCIAQQVVQRPLHQGRPAVQAQARGLPQFDQLLRRTQLRILAYAIDHRIDVHRFGVCLLGIDPGEYEDLADQGLQAVAFAGQARPVGFTLLRLGTFGQRQGDTQAGQGRAQFMGNVAQQLALATDQALQARAHAVEVVGQHAEFVPARGQAGQAVLLVGGLAQVMHRAAQAAERAGDGQGHQQAEQGQDHQCDAKGAERPDQAVAVPGVKLRMRYAVDQQVGFAAAGAGVLLGQAAPGQGTMIVALARFEHRSPPREGAGHHRVTGFVEHLGVDVVAPLALLQ